MSDEEGPDGDFGSRLGDGVRAVRGGARVDHGERSRRAGQAAAAADRIDLRRRRQRRFPASPIARVAVTLRSAALARSVQLLTEEAGRFAFTGLPAASFTVAAAKPSYLTLSYGQTTAGRGSGLPIALEAGQQLRDLRLVLPRGAVISGRVVDDRSRPVANAPIVVMRSRTVNGERTLTSVGGSWPQTDAHGGYRAYGLPPGDYIVCAFPPGDFAAIPQDCRPGGGGEGAREVSAAEVQWARQQIQAGGRGGAFTGAPPTPRPHRANRSPSVPCSIRRRRVRPTPCPSRSAEGRNARASTS